MLKPKRNFGNLKEVHKKMNDEIKKANESFRIYRYLFLAAHAGFCDE